VTLLVLSPYPQMTFLPAYIGPAKKGVPLPTCNYSLHTHVVTLLWLHAPLYNVSTKGKDIMIGGWLFIILVVALTLLHLSLSAKGLGSGMN
jgi:hypothetical protein